MKTYRLSLQNCHSESLVERTRENRRLLWDTLLPQVSNDSTVRENTKANIMCTFPKSYPVCQDSQLTCPLQLWVNIRAISVHDQTDEMNHQRTSVFNGAIGPVLNAELSPLVFIDREAIIKFSCWANAASVAEQFIHSFLAEERQTYHKFWNELIDVLMLIYNIISLFLLRPPKIFSKAFI